MHKKIWKQLWRDESGQTLMEYILIGALVAIGVIAALISTSTSIRNKLTQIVNCLNSTGTGGVTGTC